MPTLNEKQFLSSLKTNEYLSLFMFYGPDEYSKNICYNKLIKCLPESLTNLDGQELDFQSLQDTCCSVGFFSADKTVCVKNPTIDSYNQEELKTLYKIIEDKPSSTFLIFLITDKEINLRTSSKWAKFVKEIENKGTVIFSAEKTQANVISMINSTVKKKSCTIEPKIATELAEKCLNNMLLIDNDLTKICAYASQKNNGIITKEIIENLSARQLDYKSYEIVKFIISKNLSSALEILSSLFIQQIDAIAINSSIATAFIDIYRVKTMQQYNHSLSELCEHFDYKGKDYKLRSAGYDANKCSIEFLRNAITLLSETDILLKSTKDNKQTLIEKAIIKIIIGEKAVTEQL